jgi:DNA segregation ATPase FtsK/SpoIIIE, S-DNA-T family
LAPAPGGSESDHLEAAKDAEAVRLKFTYHRASGAAADLVAELDAQTTVGQLASHLALADPTGAKPAATELTLALEGTGSQLLDSADFVAESGLSSGATVSLAPAPQTFASDDSDRRAAAKLTVVAGPDEGREFMLRPGSAIVGREVGCEVTLTDPMVSRRHARLNIGDTIEVIDQGSANGLMVASATVQRATLQNGDTVTLGDTEFRVTLLRAVTRAAGAIQFIRPARVVQIRAGREFEAPAPPERRQAQRFPTIALVTPLIMGGVLFLTTHQLASIIFVALSPMMLVGNAVESRIVSRKEFAKAVTEFESDLEEMVKDVRSELETERAARLREHPSAAEAAAAALERGELLWSRRPDLPGFGELRLGLGKASSRSTVVLPNKSKAPYDLVRKLEENVSGLRDVDGVPIPGTLGAGALGVAGPRSVALPIAYGLVTQAVALHSPAELVVAGLLNASTAGDWEWMKWLPHVGSAQSPLSGRELATGPGEAAGLISQLEALIEERSAEEGTVEPRVMVVIESGSPVAHNRLVALSERGAKHGIHVLWVAPDRSQLPAACKVFVEVPPSGGEGKVGYVVDGEEVTPVALESVDQVTAAGVARALAPVDDASALNSDDSDLPRTISQFATLQDTSLGSRPDSVLERWQESYSITSGPLAPAELPRRAGTLRAVIGMSAAGPHALDLRTDGPHALVGGSTNSGKSELLQSWILSMAATHSPDRLTFLLVDYKGGSAFADCVNLPHTVGLVTDLSPHMVRRALTSLAAELVYREHLLRSHNAKDLIEMEKHGISGAPPSLVLVVDEFAALVNEVPEFIDGVVNVAARGRSLGLHLILATQQPSGVIKGSLRANTNLRIALRVTDQTDSDDVIGAPDAAAFDPLIPGRAMSRSGPTRLVAFQTAYAGGWTSDEPDPPELRVEELSLGASAVWEQPATEAVARERDQTDIKRLVARISEANERAQIPMPRKPWLPVLPATVDVSTLPRSRRDDELVFALGDDPERQLQPPVAFYPDREGNLAVYGTGGAGKSTLLRSLAISAAFSQRGGVCHVYGLDFGSRALQMLEVLPHVGSIIPGDDTERVIRLIRWLRQTVDERAARYATHNARTIREYRERANQPAEPRILVLVDNIGALRQAYEGTANQRFMDMLTSVASDGRPVGIHLAVAAAERIAINTTLSSAIQRRLVMRLATEDEYAMLGAPTDVLDAQSPAGRAIDGEQEIQVGILGPERDDASQAQRLSDMAEAMRASAVAPAPPIVSLATAVSLDEVPDAPQELTLGLASDTLAPIGVDMRGGFIVTGPPGSGLSTTLQTILAAVRRSAPKAELHYFGNRRSPLATLPAFASVSLTVDEITQRAQQLADRLSEDADGTRVVIITESAGDLVMSPAENALQALVRACVAGDQWFVAEGEVSTLRSSSGFLGLVKSSRRGIALQPDQETGSTIFSTPFPRTNRADFPEGRGYLVGSGRVAVTQVALPALLG